MPKTKPCPVRHPAGPPCVLNADGHEFHKTEHGTPWTEAADATFDTTIPEPEDAA